MVSEFSDRIPRITQRDLSNLGLNPAQLNVQLNRSHKGLTKKQPATKVWETSLYRSVECLPLVGSIYPWAAGLKAKKESIGNTARTTRLPRLWHWHLFCQLYRRILNVDVRTRPTTCYNCHHIFLFFGGQAFHSHCNILWREQAICLECQIGCFRIIAIVCFGLYDIIRVITHYDGVLDLARTHSKHRSCSKSFFYALY